MTQPEQVDAATTLRAALGEYRAELERAQGSSVGAAIGLLAGSSLALEVEHYIEAQAARPWAPSWAVVADHPCVTVRCSHCGADLDCDGEGSSYHYGDVAEALKAGLDYGFVQDSDRLLCKTCAGEIVCARDGHAWEAHHDTGFTGYQGHVYPDRDWWECTVCEEHSDARPEGWVAPPVPSSPTLLDPWAGDPS